MGRRQRRTLEDRLETFEMKITEGQLKRIIREELENTLNEMPIPKKSSYPGPLGVVSDLTRGIWFAIMSHIEDTVPDEDPQKEAMLAAVAEEAEQEEAGAPSGYDVNPNNPWRQAESKNKGRTSAGNVTASERAKSSTLPDKKGTETKKDDRFPIFDPKSAKSAIRLRGHDTTKTQRIKIINKAAKYAPGAAKKARKADKDK